MIFRIIRKPLYLCGIFPFRIKDGFDEPDVSTIPRVEKERKEKETGWDRLYSMYSFDEFGNWSPEMNAVIQSGFMGIFVGFIYGGISNSRVSYIDFMERNEATIFKSPMEAKKKLQNQVTTSFGKGAFKWGWRLGLFTSMLVLTTTTISVYRGHSSILEYVVGGAVAGSLYKINLGLRGMIVGGTLGSIFGGVAGVLSLAILKATGLTMEDIRYWQYHYQEDRTHRFLKTGKYRDDSDFPLLEHHNEVLGSTGKNLAVLDSSSPAISQSTQPSQ